MFKTYKLLNSSSFKLKIEKNKTFKSFVLHKIKIKNVKSFDSFETLKTINSYDL